MRLDPLIQKYIFLDYELNTGRPTVAVVIIAPQRLRKEDREIFKLNFSNWRYYIGIYTVCLVLIP